MGDILGASSRCQGGDFASSSGWGESPNLAGFQVSEYWGFRVFQAFDVQNLFLDEGDSAPTVPQLPSVSLGCPLIKLSDFTFKCLLHSLCSVGRVIRALLDYYNKRSGRECSSSLPASLFPLVAVNPRP